jgi:membrane-bound lytic murein transglycosylase D
VVTNSKKLSRYIVFSVVFISLLVNCVAAETRRGPFTVPSKLRPRVNFWKDVFAKYSSGDFVIHHREYPHVRFDEVSLIKEQQQLSKVGFAAFKKRVEETRVAAVKRAIQRLSRGVKPNSSLERHIHQEMSKIGNSPSQYNKILQDDLIRTQTGIRERYAEAIARSGRYLPIMEKIFLDAGVPVELTRLPFIESSFDYTAYSSVGAAGIWQFMRATARGYMTVNHLIDERRDPIAATRAAAKYLRSAYTRLGDWGLAITSYNHGVAGVAAKVRKAGTSDIVQLIENPRFRVFGFASENFYPEFLAAVEMYEERRRLFPGVREEKPLTFWEYRLRSSLSIAEASRRVKTSLSELKKTNYALSSSIWDGKRRVPAGYSLKIPLGKGELPTISQEPTISSVRENTLTHTVRYGESLGRIATQYRTSVSDLKEMNNLESSVIRPGQMLVVRTRKEPPSHLLSSAVLTSTTKTPSRSQELRRSYKVRKGDTLSEIAEQYGVSTTRILAANSSSNSTIRVGEVLKIPSEGEQSNAHEVAHKKRYHTVSRGQVLSTIARRYGISVSKLKTMNELRNSRIYPGQKLVVGYIRGRAAAPRGTTATKRLVHLVRKGEAISTIASKYGVSVQVIQSRNGLKGNRIYAGQKLVIR